MYCFLYICVQQSCNGLQHQIGQNFSIINNRQDFIDRHVFNHLLLTGCFRAVLLNLWPAGQMWPVD